MATIVASAIAGVELVLLVVAGILLLGKSIAPRVHEAAAHHARAAAVSAAPDAAATSTPSRHVRAVATLPRARTQVIILNGNGLQGAAADAASLVEARGYPIKKVGNAPRTNYARTLVQYSPGLRKEAVRLTHDLNSGVVTPLDGLTPKQLHGAKLVLILGAKR